jgi:hypothetical protein
VGLTFVDSVESDKLATTSNFLIFGPPGIGKSAGSGTAPGPILYLNAEGHGRAKYARKLHGDKLREVAVTGKDVLREAMLAVKDDPSKWGTVVLDTAGETYRVLVDEAAGGNGTPLVQHYGEAGNTLDRFVRFMRDQPVNLVVVSHEEMTDGPDGPLLMPGGFGNKLPPKVCGYVDYVGYVGVVGPDDGDKGIERRVAQFTPGRGRYAKDSEGALGPVRDLDIEAWLDRIAGAPVAAPSRRKPAATQKDGE